MIKNVESILFFYDQPISFQVLFSAKIGVLRQSIADTQTALMIQLKHCMQKMFDISDSLELASMQQLIFVRSFIVC